MVKKNILLPVLFILGLVAVLIYYYLNNPNGKGLFPFCTFKLISGLDCMGCGAQRSLHALLHGQWSKALRYNALFVVLIPFWIKLGYDFFRENLLGYKVGAYSINSWGKAGIYFFILVTLFTIIRNLPYYPFTLLATPD